MGTDLRDEAAPDSRASPARAAMLVPDAYASRQPCLPHLQARPLYSTVRWPSSPALPVAPRYSCPSRTRPPPIPVEMVRYTRSWIELERPAPNHHSANAPPVASFSTAVGR